jgi:uncharacterized membrane protein YcaP (DUF421 family)
MDLFFRAAFLFGFIYFLTRVVGKRELSSLEPFDLILLIVLGDAVQQGLTQDDYSVTGAMIVISVIALLQVFVSYLGFRFPKRLGPVLEGEPMILVHDGNVLERNLRRERLTVDEIAEAGRQQNVASIDQIQFAVLETDGQITVIPKNSQ